MIFKAGGTWPHFHGVKTVVLLSRMINKNIARPHPQLNTTHSKVEHIVVICKGILKDQETVHPQQNP